METSKQLKSTENIPTWSLPYLINDDPSGLTDEEIKLVDDFVNKWGVVIITPIEVGGEIRTEFSCWPLFGLAAEVAPCVVIYSKQQ